ncbi:hypothetical protein [Streptomyces sp. NPDC020362]|uniref:hypothetical protein n=1 Tax=unclassified Streptomyces TaxID=2593676 RepID=UPI000B2F6682
MTARFIARFIALYETRTDPAAFFARHLRNVHIPLAQTLPGSAAPPSAAIQAPSAAAGRTTCSPG